MKIKEETLGELSSFFLKEKPILILKCLLKSKQYSKKVYASKLVIMSDTTISHTIKILKMFKFFGFTESITKGRRNFLNLTEKGEHLARLIEDLDIICLRK